MYRIWCEGYRSLNAVKWETGNGRVNSCFSVPFPLNPKLYGPSSSPWILIPASGIMAHFYSDLVSAWGRRFEVKGTVRHRGVLRSKVSRKGSSVCLAFHHVQTPGSSKPQSYRIYCFWLLCVGRLYGTWMFCGLKLIGFNLFSLRL